MFYYLPNPKTKKSSFVGEGNGVTFGQSSMQGWRRSMEDNHICEPRFTENSSQFAVFDGHNGREVADFCAMHFGPQLQINQHFIDQNYEKALNETCRRMDDMLIERSRCTNPKTNKVFRMSFRLPQAGCTANIVLIVDGIQYCANVGDSRAILYQNNKKIIELSVDHKPFQKIERARIIAAGGHIFQGRIDGGLNLSRAMGDFDYKANAKMKPDKQMVICVPDIKKHVIDPSVDKFVVIGCDGVWELINKNQVCDIVNKKLTTKADLSMKILAEACEEICDRNLAKTFKTGLGLDNMTAIQIKFDYK